MIKYFKRFFRTTRWKVDEYFENLKRINKS